MGIVKATSDTDDPEILVIKLKKSKLDDSEKYL